MYLSHNGFYIHDRCSFMYYLQYIEERPVPREDDNRLGSIFGSSIGKLFETFYEYWVWSHKDPIATLQQMAPHVVDATLAAETTSRINSRGKLKQGGVLRWQGEEGSTLFAYKDRDALVQDVVSVVENGVRVIREEKLIGKRNETEVVLDSRVKGHVLAGRCDFLITDRMSHGDSVIWDGKGTSSISRKRKLNGETASKYVHKEQLLFYVGLMRLKLKRWPDRIGFVYWREPDLSDWWQVDKNEVNELFEHVVQTANTIEANQKLLKLGAKPEELFPARPSLERCQYCSFRTSCPSAKLRKKEGEDENG